MERNDGHLIIENQISPTDWKTSRTIMIPKPGKDDYSVISAWRPITITSTVYRILMKYLTWEMYQWILFNNLISIGQKSMGKFVGCHDHNAMLNLLIQDVRRFNWKKSKAIRMKKQLLIVFLDFTNAFGSVPINTLIHVLRRFNVSENAIKLINHLYQNNFTNVTCGVTKIDNLPIRRGVKQGCPLSMLLFNLFINIILRAVESLPGKMGYELGSDDIRILAYADDIALISDSGENLQTMIHLAQSIGDTLGMKFNPPKCALLPVPFNKDIIPPKVNGQSIGLVSKGKPYKYLGTKRTFFRNIDIKDILQKCLKETKQIVESDLHPHQKVHAYNTFIHSQLPFHLRHGRIPLANFTTNSTSAPAYDPAVRQLLVRNFGLIKGAPVDFFYASKEAGGAQIASALDEYLIQSIVYIMRLINNNDPRLISAIKNDLIKHLSTKNLNFGSFESAIRFINTDQNHFTHLSKSEWVRIQIARQQLKKLYETETTVTYSTDNLIFFDI